MKKLFLKDYLILKIENRKEEDEIFDDTSCE